MSLKWQFPPTGGGIAYGFNDSGQEHFRADAWENAIREVIQNSLDAVKERDKPVTIRIFLTDVPSSEIGAGDLVRHMSAALKDAKSSGGQEELRFYEKAVKMLRKSTISMLGITDTNTTGLVDDKWEALVYKEGAPNKRGMSAAGGSFGIGKNAPYLVSGIKTVCYSTRYPNRGREEKFIARCKISAHPDPGKPDTMLQHIGFGTKEPAKRGCRVLPTRGKSIYPGFKLDDVGSGIFILGFEPLDSNWIKKAKETVACNFFAAIHEKRLRIRIENEGLAHEITHETLDEIFETVARREPAKHYYHLIRNANAQEEEIQGKIGTFSMRLDVGNDDYPNRIAYINRRGMLVTDDKRWCHNPFSVSVGVGWAKYVAVLRATDDKTDERIRKMEPPNHKSIEYKRIIDVQERDKTKTKLAEVRKVIEEIVGAATNAGSDRQEINLHELWEIMPVDENLDGEGSGGEGDLETRVIPYRPPRKAELVPDNGGAGGGKGGGDGRGGQGGGKTGGVISGAHQQTIFGRARAMRHGSKLRVAFTPARTVEQIRFTVRSAGEETKFERVIPVSDAQVVSPTDAHVALVGDTLQVKPQGEERIVLDLEVGRDVAYTGYEMLEYDEKGDGK